MARGFAVRHEHAMTDALCQNREVLEIFEEEGWMEYFEILNELHEGMVLKFPQNMEGEHFEVGGDNI